MKVTPTNILYYDQQHSTRKHTSPHEALLNLTHWGRIMHICISKLTIIGSGNGLSPGQRYVITWTYAGILLIGPLWTNFSETEIKIHTFSFKKMHLKTSAKRWPFCPQWPQCVTTQYQGITFLSDQYNNLKHSTAHKSRVLARKKIDSIGANVFCMLFCIFQLLFWQISTIISIISCLKPKMTA